MIKTYDLTIFFGDSQTQIYLNYHNLSRVAVKRYLDYYSEDGSFIGYSTDLPIVR